MPITPMGMMFNMLAMGMLNRGAVRYFKTDTIAITPTRGAECLANWDFSAWTGDNPDGWTVTGESGTDPEVTQRDPDKQHADAPGTGAANFFKSNTANHPTISQTGVLTAQSWYYIEYDITAHTMGWHAFDVGALVGFNAVGKITWSGRVTKTSFSFYAPTNSGNWTVDYITCKPLDGLREPHSHAFPYGDFSVKVAAATHHCGGVDFNIVDANNYSRLYLYENKLYLLDVKNGSTTQIGSWPVTYVEGAKMTARRYLNGTRDILYGGSTLASGLAASGLEGLDAGPMLTSADHVTISEYEWSADFLA